MIKHFKAFGKEFDFKGLKKEIEVFERSLGKLTSIKSYKQDITGIIGLNDGSFNAEHATTFYVMFGQHELRDEETFNKKIDEFLSRYENKTVTVQDLPIFRAEADKIFSEHVCTEDKRRTPEQHQQDIIERNKLHAEIDEKHRKENEAKEIEKQRLLKEYPYLLRPSNTVSSRITATKNIRIELDRAFPGHKFSITSDTFSGGDSIDVRWTDGVTAKEVDEIIRKYQEGHFDGMSDMYEYGDRVFNNTFGGAKYVHSNREVTKERYSQVGEELGYHVTLDERWNFTIYKNGEQITDERERTRLWHKIKEMVYSRSFYCKPEKNTAEIEISSESGITIQRNHEHDGIEIKFPGKPQAEILSRLKANGFRWNNRTKVWYKKYSENARIFAESLTLSGKTQNSNEDLSGDSEEGLITQEYQTFERGLMQESFREGEQ